ncbi:MAG TPA: FimV/HubP family polar landmark protein, partial [Lysobacter sp.]
VADAAGADADAAPSWGRPDRGPVTHVPAAGVIADDGPLPQADAANVERLELAQAYLDLGDADSARRLLAEVADTGDATSRGVAAKMLRDIG